MWGAVGTADMITFSWLAQQQGVSGRHAVFSRGWPSGHSHVVCNTLLNATCLQELFRWYLYRWHGCTVLHINDLSCYIIIYIIYKSGARLRGHGAREPDHRHLGQLLLPSTCHVSTLPWLPPTEGKTHLFHSLLYHQSLGQLLACSRCSVSLWCVRISECHPANFRQSQGETNSSPTLFSPRLSDPKAYTSHWCACPSFTTRSPPYTSSMAQLRCS